MYRIQSNFTSTKWCVMIEWWMVFFPSDSCLPTRKNNVQAAYCPAKTYLQIISRNKANLAMTITSLVPLRVCGWPIKDLQAVAFLKAQFLVIGRGKGVECHHNVQHILRHRVRVQGVIHISFFLGVVTGKPSRLRSALPSPPSRPSTLTHLIPLF